MCPHHGDHLSEVRSRRWDFISENRADFGVQRICRVLGASRAGFYRYLATAQERAERRAEETRTVAEIRAIHAEHQGAYGAPRVHAELRARGRGINRKRVTRLMRVNDIVGRHLRRKKRTTIADTTAPPAPDLVMRDFTADTLNTRWCGDITYIAVGSTWLYLATVIDICSRKVVGWSIADHMRTELVETALKNAAATSVIEPLAIFHSDRGSVYTSGDYRTLVKDLGMRSSAGRTGVCWDNAMAESFFSALKNERVYRTVYATKAQARRDVIAYIEGFYNSRRRHSALGYRRPDEVHYGYVQPATAA